MVRLPAKFSHSSLFLSCGTCRTCQSKRDAAIAEVDTLDFDFDLLPFPDDFPWVVDPLAGPEFRYVEQAIHPVAQGDKRSECIQPRHRPGMKGPFRVPVGYLLPRISQCILDA